MYDKIFIERDMKMKVQLNTTTNNYQNPNFNAKFSKRAQVYADNELKQLKKQSGGKLYRNYYKRCLNFAKDLIKDIQNEKRPFTRFLIDLNDENDGFVCKEYMDDKNTSDENANLVRIWSIPNKFTLNPFLKELMAIKSILVRFSPRPSFEPIDTDQFRYDKISQSFPVRPDKDFIMKERPHRDVRNAEVSTIYHPLEKHYVSGWNKEGKYYTLETWMNSY